MELLKESHIFYLTKKLIIKFFICTLCLNAASRNSKEKTTSRSWNLLLIMFPVRPRDRWVLKDKTKRKNNWPFATKLLLLPSWLLGIWIHCMQKHNAPIVAGPATTSSSSRKLIILHCLKLMLWFVLINGKIICLSQNYQNRVRVKMSRIWSNINILGKNSLLILNRVRK